MCSTGNIRRQKKRTTTTLANLPNTVQKKMKRCGKKWCRETAECFQQLFLTSYQFCGLNHKGGTRPLFFLTASYNYWYILIQKTVRKILNQCCGSGMFYLGSRIRIPSGSQRFSSRIPDPTGTVNKIMRLCL
jgi:hypothetical protein